MFDTEFAKITELQCTADAFANRVIGYRMWMESRPFAALHAEEMDQALAHMGAHLRIVDRCGGVIGQLEKLEAWSAYWRRRLNDLPAQYRDGSPAHGFEQGSSERI